METVSFTQMKDATKADLDLLVERHRLHADGVADRVLHLLRDHDSMDGGYKIGRRRHAVQSATRAWRDGADADWVVGALLHDLGDDLAPFSDGHLPAAILKPFVREQVTWTVAHHTVFQTVYYAHLVGGDPAAREAFRDSPYFDDCAEFCERWDQSSFDPGYPDEPLSRFEPLVHAIFSRAPNDPAMLRPGAREPLTDPGTAATRAKDVT